MLRKEPPYIRNKKETSKKRRELQQTENQIQVISSLNRITHEQNAAREQAKSQEKKKSFRDWITVIALFSAAVAAIVAVIVAHLDTNRAIFDAGVAANVQHEDTMKALGEARRSADASEKTLNQTQANFRDQQRPYIWLTNVPIGPGMWPPGPRRTVQVLWSWQYTNYGKSPALHVAMHQEIKFGNGPFLPSLNGGGPIPLTPRQGGGEPLPPNKFDFTSVISPPISSDEAIRLFRSDGGITIRMRITYTDAYKGSYETDVCLSTLATKAVSYCQSGNDMK